jgi:hypothetical protein
MTDTIRQQCEQIVELCRTRWPNADWITIEGPQVQWHENKGLEVESQWFLYVADRANRSFQLRGSSAADLLTKLQELPQTPPLARTKIEGM